MTEAKLRCIAAETQTWRTIRDSGVQGLQDGLRTGDFADAPRDPVGAQEAGFPLTSGIQQNYMDVIGTADLTTKTTYLTGLELQLNLLEAARRTTSVFRGTRFAALIQTQRTPAELAQQGTLLDDLILSDTLPVGTAADSAAAPAPTI
jgi:hypothetical protein